MAGLRSTAQIPTTFPDLVCAVLTVALVPSVTVISRDTP